MQLALSKKIITEDQIATNIKQVAGVNVAYLRDRAVGAVAVLDYETFELLETKTAKVTVKFPYIPTLLAFRELPAAVAAIKKLKLQPDVFLVDGHGLAHPFRCGFASHLGIVLGKPTVGVAKSKLIGEPKRMGNNVFLVHQNETVGAILPTNFGTKSLYISIGHKTTLLRAIEIVKKCIHHCYLPQPILEAHYIASKKFV
ncbi:MAG: endonuclease V [Candidatus Bathyarchaeota archaeon]|nr:endonuclease V [Candidatus Bathyarchaeota archaeon]